MKSRRTRNAKRAPQPDPKAVASKLLAWYEASHRPLPWRESRDPYLIWVSEVMLQQTRVEAVVPFFTRFVRRFPDIRALADADLDEVLKLWEGLGYYARARNLHRSARLVSERGWPRSADELATLPGIGRSTAGAIASIAFSEPAPILDGNVKRVWARLVAYDLPPVGAALRALWALSARAVLCGEPGAVNQALMELGATVCTPRVPACKSCPVSRLCLARRQGDPEAFPVRVAKRPRRRLQVSLAILWKGRQFLVQKRPAQGFLGGLWELPGGKWEKGEDAQSALRRELREELGVDVEILAAHPAVRHAYTHFDVTLHPFDCSIVGPVPQLDKGSMRWIYARQIPSLAFPAGTHKVFGAALRRETRAAEQEGPYQEP